MNESHAHEWIGRTETLSDTLNPVPCKALAATLNQAWDPKEGDKLPPLWHWLYFLETAQQEELAADGHRKRGGFLPPVQLPRRMWAGSQIQFHSPITLGETLTRQSTIEHIRETTGRSGALTFVKVRHEIGSEQRPALTEIQNLVYREAAKPGVAPPAPAAAESSGDYHRELTADSRLLFRYSALTFNAHRIHYDYQYATHTEGYPGIIVHGPLLATLMLELLRSNFPEETIKTFEFRALGPVFGDHRFSVHGTRPNPDGNATLWIANQDGQLCMQGTANIEL